MEELYYPSSENKGADQLRVISFAVTAKLICAFVFAYADCWFSHGVAHFFFLFIDNLNMLYLRTYDTLLTVFLNEVCAKHFIGEKESYYRLSIGRLPSLPCTRPKNIHRSRDYR